MGFPGSADGKEPTSHKRPKETHETQIWSLGREDRLEGTATHSSILAWRIPWTEEPGRLYSTGLQSYLVYTHMSFYTLSH